MRRIAFVLIFALLVAACSSSHESSSSSTSGRADQNTPSAPGDDWSQIPAIARRLEPSIVTIRTADGLGSGVVFSKDGIIATDAHVVGTSSTVRVVFADGRDVAGHVVARTR